VHRHPGASKNRCETAPDDVKQLSAGVDIIRVARVGGGSRGKRERKWGSAAVPVENMDEEEEEEHRWVRVDGS
jgi:hypothetical protein